MTFFTVDIFVDKFFVIFFFTETFPVLKEKSMDDTPLFVLLVAYKNLYLHFYGTREEKITRSFMMKITFPLDLK